MAQTENEKALTVHAALTRTASSYLRVTAVQIRTSSVGDDGVRDFRPSSTEYYFDHHGTDCVPQEPVHPEPPRIVVWPLTMRT